MTYSKLGKIFRTMVFILTLLSPYISKAQKVAATLDSNFVEFGNPVKLQISASVKSGQKVTFPKFQDNKIIPELEILSETKPDTFVNQKDVTFTHTYFITSYQDSSFVIPSFAIKIDKDTLYTDSLEVTFTLLQNIDSSFTAEIDTTKAISIFDIRDVKEAPWTFEEFWARFGHLIMIILLVIIITAIATYCYIRWKNNKPIIPIMRPKEPAHKTALKELTKIKDQKLWQNGHTKEYYTKITEILKKYISDRYQNSVMESTSGETLKTLEKFMERKSESYESMEAIFDVADFVKFAKLEPSPEDNENSIKNAFKFVEITKKVEEEDAKNDASQNSNINKEK